MQVTTCAGSIRKDHTDSIGAATVKVCRISIATPASLACSRAAGQGSMGTTREIYWNVGGGEWIYLLFVVAAGFLAAGLRRRVRLWRLGRPGPPLDRLAERAAGVVREVFGHARLLRVPYAGVAHGLLFYAFLVLFAAWLLIALQEC